MHNVKATQNLIIDFRIEIQYRRKWSINLLVAGSWTWTFSPAAVMYTPGNMNMAPFNGKLITVQCWWSLYNSDVLVELFYSGRPYKVILLILQEKYGVKWWFAHLTVIRLELFVYPCYCSLRWLKAQYKQLWLSRRQPNPPNGLIRSLIRVILICV